MTVGGWFDARRFKDPTSHLQNHRKNNPKAKNSIVMGALFLMVVGLMKWENIFIMKYISGIANYFYQKI